MNEALLAKIKSCATLPSLPTIAVQVLDLTQKQEVDIAEIARLISRDPALSGKILKTVNSSFYGRSKAVGTISQALVILGLQSVKTLVLGFSLVSNLTDKKSRGFHHLNYWKHSIFAATGARLIAGKVGIVQQEEAFLIALLADIGMLVLHQVLGDAYSNVLEQAQSHEELPALEMAAFGMTHAQASGILAEQWKLPPMLSHPIAFHHDSVKLTDPPLKKLAEVVALASQCADVFVNDSPAEAIAAARTTANAFYKTSAADADAILNEIGQKTREVASLFEINIGKSEGYDAILGRANAALIEMTLQTQAQSSTLQQQNQRLQHEAITDRLTGLTNRAGFEPALTKFFADAQSLGQPMSFLMMDLDKFKSINDTYGHPAGDEVLRVVGRIVKTAARTQDVAARFGGEEMCLLLPGTSRAMATVIAETIRKAIMSRPVVAGGVSIPVTASIGVASVEPGSPLKTQGHLLKAADLALYNAKHSGRNRVKVFAPATAPAIAPASAKAA